MAAVSSKGGGSASVAGLFLSRKSSVFTEPGGLRAVPERVDPRVRVRAKRALSSRPT